MLLNNYYKTLGAFTLYSDSKLVNVKMRNTKGEECSVFTNSNCRPKFSSSVAYTNNYVSAGSFNGVIFGDGDTAPSLDDYCLSGSQVTTFASNVTKSENVSDDSMETVLLITVTNTSDTEITIKEVAFISSLYHTTSYTTNVMLDRTVLDSPVTIPAGGVGQITYTIRMNYPTV